MEQTRTARQELAYIERRLFKGAGLAKACKLEGEERRAYRLAQVDRLLAEKNRSIPMGVYLSDMFWTAAEGRQQYEEDPGPLMTLAGQQTLTDREMNRLRLILEIAGLCHDLSLHFTFDLTEAFGVKNDFWVSNKQLVEWLTTTEYEHVAMYTAYLMKKHAINVYAYGHYLPAQDELAELYSLKHQCRLGYPQSTEIPPRDYVSIILDALLAIERHWKRGERLKLKPDVVILHDEIYGVIPYQFDKEVLQAAQELFDYMEEKVSGRLVLKDYDYNAASWEEQPESVRRTMEEVMGGFAAKVREVRSKYLTEGWVEDHSLAFSYLMEHASWCGHGKWREEDEAL
jgi:hypothetical protein